MASSDNIWTGKFLYHKSFTPDVSGNDYTHASELVYSTKKLTAEWHHEYVGKNYNAEVGYVPRGNYYSFNLLGVNSPPLAAKVISLFYVREQVYTQVA